MEFLITKIEKKEEKERYINDLHGIDISNDLKNELISSDLWAIISEKTCYGLGTVVENNEISARISHFMINNKLLETNVAISLFINMEIYCIKKDYEQITVKIPANIRGLSGKMKKFFKKVGFKIEFKEIGFEGEFILLIKNGIKKCYKAVTE